MNKTVISKFWENEDIKRYMMSISLTPTTIKRAAQSEIDSIARLWGGAYKELDKKDLYEALAFLSEKLVFETGKEIGKNYTITFRVPSLAKFCPRVLVMILTPLFRSYTLGFPYDCKVVFDDKSTYEDFATVRNDIELLSTYRSSLNQVIFTYDPKNKKKKGH